MSTPKITVGTMDADREAAFFTTVIDLERQQEQDHLPVSGIAEDSDEPNGQDYWISRCTTAFDSIDLSRFDADELSALSLLLEILAES